jgi:hypothetical protein
VLTYLDVDIHAHSVKNQASDKIWMANVRARLMAKFQNASRLQVSIVCAENERHDSSYQRSLFPSANQRSIDERSLKVMKHEESHKNFTFCKIK